MSIWPAAHGASWMCVALLACGAALVSIGSQVAGAEVAIQSDGARVLFIGNSYTYVNDLPQLTRRLATSVAEAATIEVAKVTVGGATLEHHWLEGTAVETIRRGGWSHVVLQEQSTRPITDREQFFAHARRLDAEIKKVGARTVFYLTWARQHRPETQQALTDAYMRIADELDALVSPVGVAWALALQKRPGLALHDEDRSHPSPTGTYLAACVFYATLLEHPQESLPGTRLSTRFGRPDEGVAREIEALSPSDRALLQQVAWDAVRSVAGVPALR